MVGVPTFAGDLTLKFGVGTRPLITPEREGRFIIAGLDFGQAVNPSALAALEIRTYDENFFGPRDARVRCVSLRRWDLGTDYCTVGDDALDLGADVLVCDYTGVGRGCVDHIRREVCKRNLRVRLRPVTTIQSNARARLDHKDPRGPSWLIPKCDLVGAVNVLKFSNLLRLPGMCRGGVRYKNGKFIRCNQCHTCQLLKEMDDFQMNLRRAAVTFSVATGQGHHADLLFALGLASWWVTRFGVSKASIFC